VANRPYGQFCGLARALELVGERWALLVVRDLILGPKRFGDLRRGLPRIPTNILSTRLKELEDTAIVRRRVLPRPASAVVYELTPYGQELKGIVLSLGAWGARSLGDPHPDDVLNADSVALALQATFQKTAAKGFSGSYELRVGDVAAHARIVKGVLEAEPGPLPGADLVLEAGLGLRALMTGEVTPADALETGIVRISGDRRLLDRFAEIFRLPASPLCGEGALEASAPARGMNQQRVNESAGRRQLKSRVTKRQRPRLTRTAP
jgi:DNA-binding HxlR family transcriptional regulator